jgi:flagellar basal-body rod modification protein FlgD
MADSTSGVGGTSSSSSSSSSSSTSSTKDAFSKVDLNDFIKLLVTELQNQDPTQPVDNAAILEQVSQIRAIQSNTQLNTTLSSMSLGQNLSTAGALIGQQIIGKDDSGNDVAGTVDSASVTDGEVKLNVGDAAVSMKNITYVL